MADHDETVADAARITRRVALGGGAAGLAAILLGACGSSDATTTGATGTTTTGSATNSSGSAAGNPVSAVFGVKGGYRFTFVNHMTGNQYFVPTINGVYDACTLLNCSFDWTGSSSSNAAEMATAINAAIGAGVDGIATTLIAPSLAKPVAAAMRAGIPVVSYNADEPGTDRMAYIGQNLAASGRKVGARISRLIPAGGKIMVFMAVPGSADVAARLAGIEQALKGTKLALSSQAAGASAQQDLTTVDTVIGKQMTAYRGYFGLDAGSTAAVAAAIAKYGLKGEVVGGGFDLSPTAVQLLADGTIQFLVDQQLYLQGFFAVVELFLHRASDGLVGASDVDTGLKLLDRKTIKPYLKTTSRYEGTSTSAGVQRS